MQFNGLDSVVQLLHLANSDGNYKSHEQFRENLKALFIFPQLLVYLFAEIHKLFRSDDIKVTLSKLTT